MEYEITTVLIESPQSFLYATVLGSGSSPPGTLEYADAHVERNTVIGGENVSSGATVEAQTVSTTSLSIPSPQNGVTDIWNVCLPLGGHRSL